MSAFHEIVRMMGGLGNQRFQDAAVRMLALTIVRKLLLDPSASFSLRKPPTPVRG